MKQNRCPQMHVPLPVTKTCSTSTKRSKVKMKNKCYPECKIDTELENPPF